MPIAKPKPSEKHIPDADPARERSGRDPQVTELIGIARHIEAHSDQRLTLATLSGMAGLSPSRFQKVFKNAFGVSPKAYQDAIRMRLFKQALTSGGSVTDAIFESGFSSVSRIYGEPSRTMGMAPKTYRSGAP
ncbi:MAG TPA: helix-turn-helix domain-containing protein, partial [Marinobacter sp.]